MSSPLQDAVRECRRSIPLIALFSLLINVLVLTSPIYMMQMYDRVLAGGHVETLIYLTIIAGIAVLVMGALEAVRGRLLGRITSWLDMKLSGPLIETSMRASLAGSTIGAQPLRDLGSIKQFLTGPGVTAMFDAPWTPIFLVVIWLMHPLLGVISLIAAVVLFTLAIVNELVSRKTLKEAGQLSIANAQRVDSAVRNADVVQSMGMLPGFLHGWSKRNTDALKLQLQATDWGASFAGLTKFIRVFVQIAILGVGAYLVLRHELTGGGMIAASILMGRALAPVEQAIGSWKGLIAAQDSYRRLKALFDRLPPESEHLPLPAPNGNVTCEEATYIARGMDRPILQGVSFSLEPGEALGIIGPSAAGKSTLCRLLIGSWEPTKGHVRLDGADVHTWSREQIGMYIGYLPQDVELFAGTVTENIARFEPEPDAEGVVEAATIAGAHELILKLPKGYETEIGESGSFLSGGQRQLIGLARALYGRPRLIVLDEPNASLDSQGEESLINALERAKGWGAAVVVVAHQPRVLKPIDKLLLLREGRVQLFGSRDEVLAKLRPSSVTAEVRPQTIAAPTYALTATQKG